MSDKAYIKLDIDPAIKAAAEENIQKSTGLKLTQWLRVKVYEVANGAPETATEDSSSDS